jgi:folate-binding protein YgfZ
MLAHLPSRGVIAVSGPDRIAFLNGLVSNDVSRVAPGQAIWAAMLSPQGRYLTDFFILHDDDRLLLDAPRAAVPDLHAAWDGTPPEIPITAPDPRLAEAGYRLISDTPVETEADEDSYQIHRHRLGLPDGPPDLEPEKTLLLEAGFDELNGVDWRKGCYMGQELTARTKYRGLIKRRLIPVTLEASAPPPGTPILAEGTEIGTIRSSAGALALATLRLDALGKPLIAGASLVTPRIPDWMTLPT